MDTLPSGEEDSDEWLNVNADDFDNMLERNFSRPSRSAGQCPISSTSADVSQEAPHDEKLAEAQASRLQDLAKKVEEFVEGEGDLEGARFSE